MLGPDFFCFCFCFGFGWLGFCLFVLVLLVVVFLKRETGEMNKTEQLSIWASLCIRPTVPS